MIMAARPGRGRGECERVMPRRPGGPRGPAFGPSRLLLPAGRERLRRDRDARPQRPGAQQSA